MYGGAGGEGLEGQHEGEGHGDDGRYMENGVGAAFANGTMFTVGNSGHGSTADNGCVAGGGKAAELERGSEAMRPKTGGGRSWKDVGAAGRGHGSDGSSVGRVAGAAAVALAMSTAAAYPSVWSQRCMNAMSAHRLHGVAAVFGDCVGATSEVGSMRSVWRLPYVSQPRRGV